MDLRHIRYFIAVADGGSFSVGARRAFVTQPTLSAAVSALEAELGTRLLERSSRGVTLTADGQRILEHARQILRATETLKAEARQRPVHKPLRIGLLPTLPDRLVATTLASLRRLDPSRQWQSEDATRAQLCQRLASGRYDVIITSLQAADGGHQQLILANDAQMLALPRSNRLRMPVTPEALQGYPLIVRTHCEQLHAASRMLDDWRVRPVIVAKTDSDARAREMVSAGLGACLMPSSLGCRGIALLPVSGVNLSRRLGLEWIRGTARGWLDANVPKLAQMAVARTFGLDVGAKPHPVLSSELR